MKTINLRWMYPHYRHDEFVDVTDEVWAAMYQAQREMENYERRKVYHRAYYSLDAYSSGKLRTGTQQIAGRYFAGTRRNDHPPAPDSSSAGGSDSCHSDTGPPCSRLLHCRYQAAGNLPEREGIHSSKVSVAIHRGLRNMRRCYDDLFQTE